MNQGDFIRQKATNDDLAMIFCSGCESCVYKYEHCMDDAHLTCYDGFLKWLQTEHVNIKDACWEDYIKGKEDEHNEQNR